MKRNKTNCRMQAVAFTPVWLTILAVTMLLLPGQATGAGEEGSVSEKQRDWEFSHSGVMALDFYGTIEYYKSIGVAVEPYGLSRKPGAMRLELLYIGDMELEVLQAPKERPKGRAHAYGEGINHVTFYLTDFDGETARLLRKRQWIIFEYYNDDGILMENYLDTRESGNIITAFRRGLQKKETIVRKANYGIVDWKFRGHGVVVPDVDKTAEYYQSLELAVVQPEVIFDSSSIAGVELYGEAPVTPIKARIRTAKIGPLVYEFIQPLEGNGIYKESLDRRGEGVIDITFTVADLEAETAKLVEKGVKVIFRGRLQTGGAFAYFDTREGGGDIMIKLVEEE